LITAVQMSSDENINLRKNLNKNNKARYSNQTKLTLEKLPKPSL